MAQISLREGEHLCICTNNNCTGKRSTNKEFSSGFSTNGKTLADKPGISMKSGIVSDFASEMGEAISVVDTNKKVSMKVGSVYQAASNIQKARSVYEQGKPARVFGSLFSQSLSLSDDD